MSEPCNCDQVLKLQAKVDQLIRSGNMSESRLFEYLDFGRDWVTSNYCDGEDRSSSGSADSHYFNSPDLYELVADMIEDMVENFSD